MYSKLFFLYLLKLFIFPSVFAAIEGDKCQRNTDHDSDHGFNFQDFGPKGIRGPVNVTMAQPMRPGAVVSVVTKSDARGNVNLISDDIYVIHVDARIKKHPLLVENQLVVATSTHLAEAWNVDMLTLPNPVLSGAKTTTTLVYELEGFRIFINGREVVFYKHRTNRPPKVINLQHDFIYKVMYLTTVLEDNHLPAAS